MSADVRIIEEKDRLISHLLRTISGLRRRLHGTRKAAREWMARRAGFDLFLANRLARDAERRAAKAEAELEGMRGGKA